ncbi:hypothetical protein PP404_06330 [Mycobacteroides abscessus]|nr:hypothetical protein [Mycobacteroides abscessus]MDM2176017.1 hypothetical protein [Mycobacteroides abscessus]MDM2207085.1 hypothetical protein [Mycobacteroides abscessus]MDM2210179.1 hypothetical protein [Mycobacteroides abscessus]MDM2217361.1 hypothetical protein [Mycobacteroides abscessus]
MSELNLGTEDGHALFDRVWDALTDTKSEADDLQARAELLHSIQQRLDAMHHTTKTLELINDSADERISDLLHGNIAELPHELLAEIASKLGIDTVE